MKWCFLGICSQQTNELAVEILPVNAVPFPQFKQDTSPLDKNTLQHPIDQNCSTIAIEFLPPPSICSYRLLFWSLRRVCPPSLQWQKGMQKGCSAILTQRIVGAGGLWSYFVHQFSPGLPRECEKNDFIFSTWKYTLSLEVYCKLFHVVAHTNTTLSLEVF